MIKKIFCLFLLIALYMTSARPASDIRSLLAALENEPDNVGLMSELAREYYSEGFFTDAIDVVKSIIKKDGETPEDLNILELSLIRKKRFAEADFYFDIMAGMSRSHLPEHYSPAVHMGDYHYEKGDYEKALKYFRYALQINSVDPDTNMKAGIACQTMNEHKMAVAYLSKASSGAEKDIRMLVSYHTMAVSARQNKNTREMMSLIEKAVSITERLNITELTGHDRGRVSSALFFCASQYMESGEYEKAKRQLLILASCDPEYVGFQELMMSLADKYAEKNELLRLAEIYSQLVTGESASSEIYMRIAGYFASMGDWEGAYIYASKGAALSGGGSDAEFLNTASYRYGAELAEALSVCLKEKEMTGVLVNANRLAALSGTDPGFSKYGIRAEDDIQAPYTVLLSGDKYIEKTSDVYAHLARKFFDDGEFVKASSSLKKSLDLWLMNPAAVELFLRVHPSVMIERERLLGEIDALTAKGSYDEALFRAEESGGIIPADIRREYISTIKRLKDNKKSDRLRMLTERGKIYYGSGKYITSRYYFNKALSMAPDNSEAKDYLRRIRNAISAKVAALKSEYMEHEKNEDLRGMKDALNTVLLYEPKDSWATKKAYSLGIKENENKVDAARDHYLKGIEYYTEGEYEEAVQEWELALKSDPGYKNAKEYIERAKKRLRSGD